ncbi:hypothetical protein OQA88_7196 [Cercophora sp. LCS_1]
MYRQDELGSPSACRELEQYCFTGVKGERKCSQLGSVTDAIIDYWAQLDEGDDEWINTLGTQALQARGSLNGVVLGPLPNNQWQFEVQSWHATAMAHRSIIGPENPEDLAHFVSMRYPKTTIEKELCAKQKILADGYISFNILSITCIFVGGALIILLSFILHRILPLCLRGRGRETQYSKLEWSSNETPQLHRLAHEATGTGSWSRGTGMVPVTRQGDVLAVLEIDDTDHPKLRVRAESESTIESGTSNGKGEQSKLTAEVTEFEKR